MGQFRRRVPRMTFLRELTNLKQREYSLSVLQGIVTLASIVPLLLLGIYGLSQYVAEQQADRLNRMTRYTEALSNAVDRELRGYLDTAEVLAASRHLVDGDLEAFGALARDAVTKAGVHIILIAPSGQQLFNTRKPAGATLPLTEDMDSLQEVLKTDKPAVSDLFVGAVSNELLFVVRVPVRVNGEIPYVLSLEPRANVIREVVEQTYLPEGWFAAVVDGSGRLIARSSRHEDFYGKNASPEFFARLVDPRGIVESMDLDGRDVLTSYHRSSRSDWRVAIWAPKSVLDAPTKQFVLAVGAVLALTLLLSFTAAFFAGRIIAEPARRLLKGAQALGAGKPVHFKHTHMREANVVGRALAEAAHSIATREQALRKSELHTRFAMRELAHRSKNLLAVIQAIARQTSRTSTDIEDFNGRFGERLAGLGRSQDLLVQKNWRGVSMGDLVSAQLSAFIDISEPRVTTDGPPLLLSADAAQSIGMALHELATNASKHGALSIPAGRVRIDWAWRAGEEGERRLQVCWTETGGPPVKPPTRRGFGHSVIERLTAVSLHGTAELDWKPEGLVWTLDVPESCLKEPDYENHDESGDADA